jgi:Flp pilus assembly protein TadB
MFYETSIPYSKDPQDALLLARSVLTQTGFRIESLDNRCLEANGPGLRSSHQNPLRGASHVRILIYDETIHLAAELDGVVWMRNFLYLFPPALGVFLMLVFVLTGLSLLTSGCALVGALSPWLILSPLMARNIRKSTVEALDSLLQNMRFGGDITS